MTRIINKKITTGIFVILKKKQWQKTTLSNASLPNGC